jgi:hypothetical protein
MRAVVLDHTFLEGNRFLAPYTFDFEPTNPFGKSFGLSFTFQYNAPPNMASPLSLRNDENPFFQLFARGPTALGVVFKRSGGEYYNFDVTVDDMVGRPVHAVFGYDLITGFARLWVEGVQRGISFVPGGIGIFPDKTPPLIINSTVAGHQSGDITPIRLVYAVGAAPTAEDVKRLSGIVPKPAGFSNGVTDGTIWAEANGEGFADLALHDPLAFIDGRNSTMKQTVNNPPMRKRWESAVPQDVGREVSQ